MDFSIVVQDLKADRGRLVEELSKVDKALAALEPLTKTTTSKPGKVSGEAAPKRVMSAAGRKKIAAAQRARWAAKRKADKKAAKAMNASPKAGAAKPAAKSTKKPAKAGHRVAAKKQAGGVRHKQLSVLEQARLEEKSSERHPVA
jgi:hypothetical protein